MEYWFKILESILIHVAYGFCLALGVSIMSQGIMEFLDWQKWDYRKQEDLLAYSSKVGLGLGITMVFLKLYLSM